jgi:hypothetical protein
MADTTLPGIDVQELPADERDEEVVIRGWPGQLRRRGSSAELPAPQRFLDLPTWLNGPAKRPVPEDALQ